MATCSSPSSTFSKDISTLSARASAADGIDVALLTAGLDRPYVFGLSMALASQRICLDLIGGDDLDRPEMHTTPGLNFLNLRGNKNPAGLVSKVTRVLAYYARLLRYSAAAGPGIFHILWNNKFEFFDRTLLMLYYRLLGKKIAFTVHNVNAAKRDSHDSLLNRLTLRAQYNLADHLFVHTEKMRQELGDDFGIQREKITVIPFGINNSIPDTDLTAAEAKRQLGIAEDEKTILFFGAIGPYKGLEYLIDAFKQLTATDVGYRLIVAGQPKKGAEKYMQEIRGQIAGVDPSRLIQRIEYIADEETELYFKAADVLALPYTHVFQSGVLFLAHSFGLPVVATDVGAVAEEITEGRNGFLCKPRDSASLAGAIENYFESELFRNLERRRGEIRDHANATHSWDIVGETTRNVYSELLRASR